MLTRRQVSTFCDFGYFLGNVTESEVLQLLMVFDLFSLRTRREVGGFSSISAISRKLRFYGVWVCLVRILLDLSYLACVRGARLSVFRCFLGY